MSGLIALPKFIKNAAKRMAVFIYAFFGRKMSKLAADLVKGHKLKEVGSDSDLF
ncbi:hypothetical protein QE382_000676 [Sphingobacterium zeae]|uniref:Uncharacterized protein n=1 Tax=Sphingobacterium zeae TaxID=1776859 RepID=A0ABU0U156_9SPHI|nr:hypothetical protein [Sphingobacterium zeae]